MALGTSARAQSHADSAPRSEAAWGSLGPARRCSVQAPRPEPGPRLLSAGTVSAESPVPRSAGSPGLVPGPEPLGLSADLVLRKFRIYHESDVRKPTDLPSSIFLRKANCDRYY